MAESKGVVLVTGASRGSGAEAAVDLACSGHDVVLAYNSKEKRAIRVADRIRGANTGVEVSLVGGDISQADILDEYEKAAQELALRRGVAWRGIIHMAAAGLNTTLEVAEAVNHTSPLELTQRLLSGTKNTEDNARQTVVYAASHSSHLWDDESIPRPPGYELVGPTKRRGETALRSLMDTGEETESSPRVLVISGDLLTDSIVATMLAKAAGLSAQEYIESRDKVISRAIGRPGTGTIEYGQTIGRSFVDQRLQTGHTVYVPRPVFEFPNGEEGTMPQALSNDRLARMGRSFSVVG